MNIDKEINDSYIFSIMRSIFIDEKRKQPTFVEIPDNLTEEEDEEQQQDEIPVGVLNFIEHTILLETTKKSRRKFAKEMGVNYQLINRIANRGIEKLRNERNKN